MGQAELTSRRKSIRSTSKVAADLEPSNDGENEAKDSPATRSGKKSATTPRRKSTRGTVETPKDSPVTKSGKKSATKSRRMSTRGTVETPKAMGSSVDIDISTVGSSLSANDESAMNTPSNKKNRNSKAATIGLKKYDDAEMSNSETSSSKRKSRHNKQASGSSQEGDLVVLDGSSDEGKSAKFTDCEKKNTTVYSKGKVMGSYSPSKSNMSKEIKMITLEDSSDEEVNETPSVKTSVVRSPRKNTTASLKSAVQSEGSCVNLVDNSSDSEDEEKSRAVAVKKCKSPAKSPTKEKTVSNASKYSPRKTRQKSLYVVNKNVASVTVDSSSNNEENEQGEVSEKEPPALFVIDKVAKTLSNTAEDSNDSENSCDEEADMEVSQKRNLSPKKFEQKAGFVLDKKPNPVTVDDSSDSENESDAKSTEEPMDIVSSMNANQPDPPSNLDDSSDDETGSSKKEEQTFSTKKSQQGSLFVLDTKPNPLSALKARDSSSDDDDEDSSSDEDEPVRQQRNKTLWNKPSISLESGLSAKDIYVNVDGYKNPTLRNTKIEDLLLKTSKHDEILKKSVLTADFEKKHEIPPYNESLNQIKKKRQEERAKTKGDKWYGLPATEMTEEKKNDLLVLHYRQALDPKHHYKNPDLKVLPKYFQVGTVVESAADFYHSRIPKKQRKSTLVDELLADAEFRKFNKRKYTEIQDLKRKAAGPYKHMKRLKKRNK